MDAPLSHDLSSRSVDVFICLRAREVVASNHRLKIVVTCESTKSIRNPSRQFLSGYRNGYLDIEVEIRNYATSRFH